MSTGALYRLYDEAGTLLYVGQSIDWARRLGQHRAQQPWWDEVRRVEIERLPLDQLADAERAAIRAEEPLHNLVRYLPLPQIVARSPRAHHRRERTRPYSFRVVPALLEQIDAAALAAGVPRSVWLRQAIEQALEEAQNVDVLR